MKQKLISFFATHPETDVVFSALGTLFIELEKAEAFCGGTTAKPVTHTRVEVEEVEAAAPVEKVEEVETAAPVEEVEKVEEVEVAAPVEEVAPVVEEAAPVVEEAAPAAEVAPVAEVAPKKAHRAK